MITKFDNYSLINEGRNTKLFKLALYLTFFFSHAPDVNQSDKSNYEFFVKYVNSMDVGDRNTMVQEVIRDFRHKVINDPKILNKQEVLKVIDETPILFRNNDKICQYLYQTAKEKSGSGTPSSWCTTITPEDGKPYSVIFLSKDADYYEVLHELSHSIEKAVKVDPRIVDPFDFNMPFKKLNAQFSLITGLQYSLKNSMQKEYIDYLSTPSEIYSRMNSFKMFLYRNKILKTPNDDVSELIIYELMTGKIYNNLDEKKKREFINSDFIDIIIFLDLNKRNQDLNKYVNDFLSQKKPINYG